MKITNVTPHTFAHLPEQFPQNNYTHFVFAGRSNVGKSSLINCVLNRKTIARVSKKPGKTISVNFYEINEKFFFVDLPGFGFAANDKSKSPEQWADLIDIYFRTFQDKICLFHLVDSRVGPTELDLQMEDYSEQFNFPRYIVITKSDKLKRNQLKKVLNKIKNGLSIYRVDDFILFSAKDKTGRKKILRRINEKT